MNIRNISRHWIYLGIIAIITGHGSIARATIDVTDYGAKGDLLTLNNVSVVNNSKTINCPSASFVPEDVNKLIEIFGAGAFRSVSNETLVATITGVSSSSTITVSMAAGATADGLRGVYGTDSSVGFRNAVAACAFPTDTIIIPEGNYFLICTNINDHWHAGLILQRGGIIFAGQGNAVLTGIGGWRVVKAGDVARRGSTVMVLSPFANNYALVFSNLVFDGGIDGWNGGGNNGPSTTTGEGWDVSHHAIAWVSEMPNTTFPDTNLLLNCTFHGFRGEMLIGTSTYAKGLLTINDCLFYDGDGSAINIPMAHDVNGCTFMTMNFVEEFYRSYTTNASGSIFRNNLVTNLFGSYAIALNGGYWKNPTYTISNNIFFNTRSTTFLGTTPACEVMVISNNFYNAQSGVLLSIAGYQDEFGINNSNIIISCNYFSNCFRGVCVGAGGGLVQNSLIVSNYFDHVPIMGYSYGWFTNVVFSNNVANYAQPSAFFGEPYRGQYFGDYNNNYPPCDYSHLPGIVPISYGQGGGGSVGNTSSAYYLDDNVLVLVADATMMLSNPYASQSAPIYFNSKMTGTPYRLPANSSVKLYWSNGWSTNAPTPTINLLTVNSGTGSGTYLSGQVVSVTASNMFGKIFRQWTGSTNILANPFAASTSATVPAGGATITANYNPSPPSNLHPVN